jgi:large conductance mechanosensitive channel
LNFTQEEQTIMLREFKEFALRGNVLDLAIAVIMGAAFGPIVNSLVNDIIMPPIGLILHRVDFKELFFSLTGQSYANLAAARAAGAPVIAYGNFLNTVISFVIVAFSVFLLVRQIKRFEGPVLLQLQRPKNVPIVITACL